MSGHPEACRLALPAWMAEAIGAGPDRFDDFGQAMDFAIELAGENIRRASGGPFAALVMDVATGKLLAAGVNTVTSNGLSIAHAEVMALSLAQERLGDWNLGRGRETALISTCEPCAMCYGALPWAGVRHLVYGATKKDAEAAGFDEGDKPDHWQAALERRGIHVVQNVRRAEARALFDRYLAAGGEVYNAT